MTKKRWYAVFAVALAAVVALVVVFGVLPSEPGSTADNEAAPATAAGTVEEETTLASSEGAAEGIQVHSHWTIEVREPDGTLVDRQEVDNHLVEDGQFLLSGVLSREYTLGSWMVSMGSAVGYEVFEDEAGNPTQYGFILENTCTEQPAARNVFKTLNVMRFGYTVLMTGEAQATTEHGGVIMGISTSGFLCTPDVASVNCTTCAAGTQIDFTALDLSASPIGVSPGQLVTVAVTVSFSYA